MSERTAAFDTFTLERVYDSTPAEVFAAFADQKLKSRWFAGPSAWRREQGPFEFKVGGHERVVSRPPTGPSHTLDALYKDIVKDERIVYTYTMHMDETLTSVSVATFEFSKVPGGTRLRLTEQGVFLDGHDYAGQREEGTRALLEALGRSLRTAS